MTTSDMPPLDHGDFPPYYTWPKTKGTIPSILNKELRHDKQSGGSAAHPLLIGNLSIALRASPPV